MSKSVERFTSRVETYVKYRPGYPVEIVDLFKRECDLTPENQLLPTSVPGRKTLRAFLPNGNVVFGVEPNAAMRAVADNILNEPRFRNVDGTAESTTLPDSSVDLITAAQAFHWFDPSRRETNGCVFSPADGPR